MKKEKGGVQGTEQWKYKRGLKKTREENLAVFFSYSFLLLCHFTHQYFEPVCVSMLGLQLFLCVSVGLFKVIHVSGFRGNIHCTLSSALFSSPSQFTAGFVWKSSLVPHNAGLKPSQTVFVRLIQILHIFHHSKNIWQLIWYHRCGFKSRDNIYYFYNLCFLLIYPSCIVIAQ